MLKNLIAKEVVKYFDNEDEANTSIDKNTLAYYKQTGMIGNIMACSHLIKGHFIYADDTTGRFKQISTTDSTKITKLLLDNFNVTAKDIKDAGGMTALAPVALPTFNPQKNSGLVPTETGEFKYLNIFEKSAFMEITDNIDWNYRLKMPTENQFKDSFPYTYSFLMNLCENNWIYVSQLINWLAAHLHKREKLATAWVFTGTQGGGKDTLREFFLEKLYKKNQVKALDNNAIRSNFNSHLMNSLMLVLNESHTTVKEANEVSATLKTWISDSTLKIEPKGVDSFHVDTFFGFFVFSNNSSPIPVEIGDRRFNVMKTIKKLTFVAKDNMGVSVEKYREELEKESMFVNYFISMLKYNLNVARTCISNETKRNIQYSSQKKNTLFENVIKERNIQELKKLYDELSELLLEEANDLAYHNSEGDFHSLEAEKAMLNDFMSNILRGRVPANQLTRFYILYVGASREKPLNRRQASQKLMQLFGESKAVKMNGKTSKCKLLGEEISQEYINVLIDETLSSEDLQDVIVKDDSIIDYEKNVLDKDNISALKDNSTEVSLEEKEYEIIAADMIPPEFCSISEQIILDKMSAKAS